MLDALLLTAVVAIGMACASIGILGVLSTTDRKIRLTGALCVALGIACVAAGNADALAAMGVVLPDAV